MLEITIRYDGDVVEVNQINADTEQLVRFVERWGVVAEDPCMHGHKCEVIKRMLLELREILEG